MDIINSAADVSEHGAVAEHRLLALDPRAVLKPSKKDEKGEKRKRTGMLDGVCRGGETPPPSLDHCDESPANVQSIPFTFFWQSWLAGSLTE
jgi:hypothetical protein